MQDDENNHLSSDRLITISNRFTLSASHSTTQEKTVGFSSESSLKPKMSKKKTHIRRALIITVIILLVIAGVFVFVNIITNDEQRSCLENRITASEFERSNPTKFLFAEGTYKENFWGDKIKIECVIVNTATVAAYKDAVVEITYYTKTHTKLKTVREKVYEVFPPNSTTTVKITIDNYQDVGSIDWEIIRAFPYDNWFNDKMLN